MPYAIHWRRDFHTKRDFSLIAEFHCLEDAAKARKLSGELVVNVSTGNCVDSDCWLWDWEKEDPNCYARKAIEFDKTGRESLWERKEEE